MHDPIDNSEQRASTTAVVFIVAGHPYAVVAERAREVLAWHVPRQLPGSEPWIEGVINLRGAIVPVCDLAHALGLRDRNEGTPASSIIIVEAGTAAASVGFTVDEVRSVTTFETTELVDTPGIDHPAMAGVARIDGELVVLLDPERALAGAVVDDGHVSIAIRPSEETEPNAAQIERDAA